MSNFCLSFVLEQNWKDQEFSASSYSLFVYSKTLILLSPVYMYWLLKIISVTEKKGCYKEVQQQK